MRAFLTFVLFAGFVHAQQAQPAPDQKKIHLDGKVVALNGEAVRKATVRLQGALNLQLGGPAPTQPPPTYSETTDDNGKFTFEDVAPGRYNLTSEKTGFVTQRYGARSDTSAGTQLDLKAGDQLKDLSLRMTPQAVLSGQVTDQDGDPVANAQVTVYRYGYSNGRRQLMPGGGPIGGGGGGRSGPGGGPGAGATDDQGNYRISNLSPGRYYVSANPRAGGPLFIDGQERPGRTGGAPQATSITTYYPNAIDATAAVPVDVAAGGEVRGIDIRLRKERVYSIRGKAMDLTIGAPAAGAYVLEVPPDSAGPIALGPATLSGLSNASPDGSFELRNLLPGTHIIQGSAGGTLTVSSGGGQGMMMVRLAGAGASETGATGRMEVTISDADVTGVVLQLTGGAQITGSIKLEDGDLKEWLQGAAQPPTGPGGLPPLPGPGSRSVRLASNEGISVSAPSAQFNADGTFLLKGVAPSKYFATVGGLPAGTYVKSMRLGGQDVTRTPLDLTSGAGGSLEIVLSSKAADLSGAVRNDKGEPMQGVPVTLWPKIPDKSNAAGGIRTANTDQNGGFKISGLAPGDYYVAAWDDIPEAGLAQNPDFLARFASPDFAVKLAESGHQSADTKLVPRDRLVAEAAKIP